MNNVFYKLAGNPEDFSLGKELILEYAGLLGIDLCFQNFDKEINNLIEMYSHPEGGLILAYAEAAAIGVVGIRKFENDVCELKRMYVKNEYRGKGIGKELLDSAIKLAGTLNYKAIKLDTLESMKSAIKLYFGRGFVETLPYRINPEVSVRFFELKLKVI